MPGTVSREILRHIRKNERLPNRGPFSCETVLRDRPLGAEPFADVLQKKLIRVMGGCKGQPDGVAINRQQRCRNFGQVSDARKGRNSHCPAVENQNRFHCRRNQGFRLGARRDPCRDAERIGRKKPMTNRIKPRYSWFLEVLFVESQVVVAFPFIFPGYRWQWAERGGFFC